MRHTLFLLVLLASAGTLSAQATQPADTAWPTAVSALADALVQGDTTALESACDPAMRPRTFDGATRDLSALLPQCQRSKPIFARAYIHEPLAMAADIGAAYKSARFIPDAVRRRMLPEDDAEMTRANATAAQWLADAVGAKPGDPVAVIILWPAPKADDASAKDPDPAARTESLFILVKAEPLPNKQFRIKALTYGRPLPQKQQT